MNIIKNNFKYLIRNKYFKYFLIIAVVALAFTATAGFAQDGGNVFGTIGSRMKTTFKNVRNIIFIVGGFGLIGLGFAAIFGKIKWPWLAALACGLAIVAVAGALVDYVTQDSSGSGDEANGGTLVGEFSDTIGGS